MCKSVTGLLAAGDHSRRVAGADLPGLLAGARRRLLPEFLDRRRRHTGPAYNWMKSRLPIMLAWRLQERRRAGRDSIPGPMVQAAARYLIAQGPGHAAGALGREPRATRRPTLAANIAAMICAASWRAIAARGPARVTWKSTPTFWNPTRSSGQSPPPATSCPRSRGTTSASIPPISTDPQPRRRPEHWYAGKAKSRSRVPPSANFARESVDAGFLELVRYGIRHPDDPLIEAIPQGDRCAA